MFTEFQARTDDLVFSVKATTYYLLLLPTYYSCLQVRYYLALTTRRSVYSHAKRFSALVRPSVNKSETLGLFDTAEEAAV